MPGSNRGHRPEHHQPGRSRSNFTRKLQKVVNENDPPFVFKILLNFQVLIILRTIIFALLAMMATGTMAQQRYCPTPEELNHGLPRLFQLDKGKFESWLLKKLKERRTKTSPNQREQHQVVQIPIVFHIIHYGEPIGEGGNIPDEQIISQLNVLNQDFRRQNGDTVNTPPEFISEAADTEIEFVLAQRDPEGLPTNGIVRRQGTQTIYPASRDGAETLANISSWPPDEYLNTWIAEFPNGTLGFAQFPLSNLPGITFESIGELFSTFAKTDGIFLDPNFVGSVDDGDFPKLMEISNNPFNLGRTGTHEVGHYFGLRHTWGDGGCSVDDFCNDTPTSASPTDGCPSAKDDCGSTDMVQNYLDFSDDDCMNLFTSCQKERMQTVLVASPRRSELSTSPGLLPPVMVENNSGIRNLVSPQNGSCEGTIVPSVEVRNYGTNNISQLNIAFFLDGLWVETLQFNDLLVPEALDTAIFSEIIFDQNRNYELRFEITQVNGTVDEDPSNNTRSFTVTNSFRSFGGTSESFEGMVTWIPDADPDKINWALAAAPNLTANNTAMALLFNGSNEEAQGKISLLTSPVFDIPEAEDPSLSFRYSYAHAPDRPPEGLIIAVSTDCGESFSFSNIIFEAYDAELSTVPDQGSPFTPSGPVDWREVTLSLNQFVGQNDVQIVFIGLNGGGNNMYIDDIVIDIISNDLRINTILAPEVVSCQNTFTPSLIVQNLGVDTIRSYAISLQVNQLLTETSTLNGELASSQIDTVFFDPITLEDGNYNLSFNLQLVDPAPDENPSNNTLESNILINGDFSNLPEYVSFNDTINNEGWFTIPGNSGLEWQNVISGPFESAYVPIFDQGTTQEEAFLVSPAYDLSEAFQPFIQFQYSYGIRNGFQDELVLYAIPNCNFSERVRLWPAGLFLPFTATSNTAWFPGNNQEWETVQINLEEFIGENDVRFAFQVIGNAGNNIFLDEIIINTEETLPGLLEQEFLIYPNPATSFTRVYFNLDRVQDVEITIYDLGGRIISQSLYGEVQNQNFQLHFGNHSPGIYLVNIQTEDFRETRRVYFSP